MMAIKKKKKRDNAVAARGCEVRAKTTSIVDGEV
jgi:hypothetical protein